MGGPRVRSAVDRFADKVALTETGCLLWLGATTGSGYAQLKLSPAEGKRLVYVHRWSYEHHVGPIPAGLQIDHLCRNTLCVHPDHLEAVTPRVNTLRSTNPSALNAMKAACIHGHPFLGANLLVSSDGKRRYCRECKRQREHKRIHRPGKAA